MKTDTYLKLPGKLKRLYLDRLRRDGGVYWSEELRRLYEAEHGVRIGIGSYGCFDTQAFPRGTVVGNYCSIAQDVWTFNGNHPLEAPSLYPLFYNKALGCDVDDIPRRDLTIGHGVWIGRSALIMPGCSSIGNGAVVGGGSVVTHDVPPYAIVAGNPAHVLRYRFDEGVQNAIEASRWWEWDVAELRANARASFANVDSFFAYVEEREGADGRA